MLFSIRAYYALITQARSPNSWFDRVSVMGVMFLLFACMSMYIYPVMIADLSIKNLYKNSFIFAVIKFCLI